MAGVINMPGTDTHCYRTTASHVPQCIASNGHCLEYFKNVVCDRPNLWKTTLHNIANWTSVYAVAGVE